MNHSQQKLPQSLWFHCGRCGHLFSSHPGKDDKRRCPSCGGFPAPTWEKPEETKAKDPIDSSVRQRHKRSVRKRRGLSLLTKIVIIWSLLILLAILIRVWTKSESAPLVSSASSSENAPRPLSPANQRLLMQAGPICIAKLNAFLGSTTSAERAMFVDTPGISARMDDFYRNNLLHIPPWEKMRFAGSTITKIGEKTALEIRLAGKNAASPIVFDSVFHQHGDQWFLDWESLVIYSDLPWSLFLAGTGPSEADFRLYARERLPETFRPTASISLVFYQPNVAHPTEIGSQSPEFLLKRDSPSGKLAAKAFEMMEKGKRPFASRLTSPDPEGLTRMRVRVRRMKDGTSHRFEIVKIHAVHWYDTNEPGF